MKPFINKSNEQLLKPKQTKAVRSFLYRYPVLFFFPINICYSIDKFQIFCGYAGLAPFQYTSGGSIRSKRKVSQCANKKIKSLLHLADISVIRNDGQLRSYYLRKREEGKNSMLILNAIRAKIVASMFAVIKRDEFYVKNYVNLLLSHCLHNFYRKKKQSNLFLPIKKLSKNLLRS